MMQFKISASGPDVWRCYVFLTKSGKMILDPFTNLEVYVNIDLHWFY